MFLKPPKMLTETETSLLCNYMNCKELLVDDFACVTICFHIFCKNHIIKGEGANRRCHACGAVLEGNFDVIHHSSLNPTEEVKSLLLTGFSSGVIFEIMSRAMQFWDYQINTKIMHYKLKVENQKSCLSEKERYIESLSLNIKHYIKQQKEKINYLNNKIIKLTAATAGLEKQIEAKNRQISYIQSRYDEVRRYSMATQIVQETDQMEMDELADIVCSQTSNVNSKPAGTRLFVFDPKPKPTPKSGSSGSFCGSPRSEKFLF